jgi:hypothetical protein
MKRLLIVPALVASLACGRAIAADDVPLTKPGEFEVHVVITDRGDEIFDAWDNPTGKPFTVDSIKTAPRGTFLSALVMFKNCRADKAGNCDAVVDIVAYDPSGKVYGFMPEVELWIGKPAPGPGFSQLSRSYMGIAIESKDPIGTYRITAVARDRNAKKEARSEVRFQVGM